MNFIEWMNQWQSAIGAKDHEKACWEDLGHDDAFDGWAVEVITQGTSFQRG